MVAPAVRSILEHRQREFRCRDHPHHRPQHGEPSGSRNDRFHDPTQSAARLRQVVFAAPDIDTATFKDLATAFHEKAERFTLYASSEDKALKASKAIHKYPRAGESGHALVIVGSVDTVDATAVDTSLLGHSYYGDNRSVLADVFQLIQRESPPQERFVLKPKEKYGARYWLFSP